MIFFQTRGLIAGKRSGKRSAYALHGLIHFLSASALSAFFLSGLSFSLRALAGIAALAVAHILIDAAKIRTARPGRFRDGSRALVSSQVLHFLAVLLAAWLLPSPVPLRELVGVWQASRNLSSRFLAIPVVYLAVIIGGGRLIRSLTGSLAAGVQGHGSETSGKELQNAGLYIGWLERFLVLTALLLQTPATVGLILAAKSIARYPEFKIERFAEYFLIGTLLSLSVALVGGAILAKLLLGPLRTWI